MRGARDSSRKDVLSMSHRTAYRSCDSVLGARRAFNSDLIDCGDVTREMATALIAIGNSMASSDFQPYDDTTVEKIRAASQATWKLQGSTRCFHVCQ